MSGETQVEVQIHHSHPSMGGDPMGKLSLAASGLHSSGGSTGEDSSGEEPHHHVVLPKKIRLKESSISIKSGSSLLSMIVNGGSRDRDHSMDDQSPDGEDDCSNNGHRMNMKVGGTANSLTSGENSDAEGEDHIGSHSKSEDSSKKLFQCEICEMRFSNGANMRRHKMRHSGVKPFECKICQKRKDHLAEHSSIHSKLLPFRCPICNKGFQRQIAMRAHFQNEHVGGSQDVVKACPLCAYKAGSMKSLRIHFYSRHGIDLDNPMPHSPSLLCVSNGRSVSSPGPNNGEYSELAHALGFEDREKSSDSSVIPSHFLVPQIEISSNSPYPAHFPFNPDSNYGYSHDEKHYGNRSSTPQNISPQSDSSSNVPTSSDLVKIFKKEHMEVNSPELPGHEGSCKLKEFSDGNDDVQDMPEDLSSSGNSNSYRNRSKESPPKCSSSSVKLSPLKSLLREDWRPQEAGKSNNGTGPRDRSDSSSGHSSNSNFQNQSCDGEAITSSNGTENGAPQSLYGRQGLPFTAVHLGACECVYCNIIFPDKTLYFLHKGCHSELNPWRCNICGELTENVYDFNSHLLSKSHL